MELLAAFVIFILLAGLFVDRPSRIERDRLEAFPRDRWTVYESFDYPGKWAMYRAGHEYKQYDTRAEAEAHKADLDGIGC